MINNANMNYITMLLQGAKVEWKPLGEVVVLSNTGVDKKIKENEKKVKLLNFVDVFKNHYISTKTPIMIVTASERKIIECDIKSGDIFITPSSEIIDEIGFSAMAVEDFENSVYSYHIMRLRINDKKFLYPAFLNYIFKSENVRKQILLKAQGITRFGLTKSKWELLEIPIPPLPVQEEIVRILDKFDALTNSITEGLPREIKLRKQQYEYYRNMLLTFPKA